MIEKRWFGLIILAFCSTWFESCRALGAASLSSAKIASAHDYRWGSSYHCPIALLLAEIWGMRMEGSTVFVIDDDPQVLKAITRVLASDGWATRSFRSAKDFLNELADDTPGCLVLDLLMPEMTGLDLQLELARIGQARPIVFLSGEGDVPTSVRAMKCGAVDFLTKPVESRTLLDAVRRAMERDVSERAAARHVRDVRKRFSSLTAREREVLDGVVAGLLNKQIAAQLGIVEKTVKVHRARAVAKMRARSTAELVRMVESLGGHRPDQKAERYVTELASHGPVVHLR